VRLQRRAVIVIFAAVLVASGCLRAEDPSPDQLRRDVSTLRQVLPVLAELQVTEFRDQDWCRNLAYGQGRFSSNNEQVTCNLFNGTGEPFDADADADFKVIADALRATGLTVIIVDSGYDHDGRVESAVFELQSPGLTGYWRYIYRPGERVTDDEYSETRTTPIDADWYFQWEDWM
jgi:hypothetical protein